MTVVFAIATAAAFFWPAFQYEAVLNFRSVILARVRGLPCAAFNRRLLFVYLISFASLLDAVAGHAEQRIKPRPSAVPTFDRLPHRSVPPTGFSEWCGARGRYFVKVKGTSSKLDVHDAGGVKLSTVDSPGGECSNDSRYLIFHRGGKVLRVDLDSNATKLVATYQQGGRTDYPIISFSPDLRRVVTDRPLNLTGEAGNPTVLQLYDLGTVGNRFIRWSHDSSMLLATTNLDQRPDVLIIEIFDEKAQKVGSGNLPWGTGLQEAWFDEDMQHVMLYITSNQATSEQGGSIFRCEIKEWKCERIMERVDVVASDGRSIVGTVRDLTKTTSIDGDGVEFPTHYLVEIKNRNGVLVRQEFSAFKRSDMNVRVAPSGRKAVVTWISELSADCRWGLGRDGFCVAGMIVDLPGVLK